MKIIQRINDSFFDLQSVSPKEKRSNRVSEMAKKGCNEAETGDQQLIFRESRSKLTAFVSQPLSIVGKSLFQFDLIGRRSQGAKHDPDFEVRP
jgi:hypothetical protein